MGSTCFCPPRVSQTFLEMPFNFLRSKSESRQASEKEVSDLSSQPQKRDNAQDLMVLEETRFQEQAEFFQKGNNLILQERYKEGIVLLKKAAAAPDGHVQAQAVLGFCYEFGLGGLKTDAVMAEKYYMLAASKQNGLAYCRLAFFRYYGRAKVVIDRAESEEWKAKASELGEKCIEWLETAANEYQIPAANYSLGVCFHDGYFIILMLRVGVTKNPEKAIHYYKRAAAMGDSRAEGTLGKATSL